MPQETESGEKSRNLRSIQYQFNHMKPTNTQHEGAQNYGSSDSVDDRGEVRFVSIELLSLGQESTTLTICPEKSES